MKRLVVEQVLSLHEKIIQATGGSMGLRDKCLLESSISNAYRRGGSATIAGRLPFHKRGNRHCVSRIVESRYPCFYESSEHP